MSVIWAARGHSWGFRFLRDGGHPDPLLAYEAAFAASPPALDSIARHGTSVVARLTDPEGRRDAAGRPIVHDFVIDGADAEDLHGIEDVRAVIWGGLAAEYAALWESTSPPSR